MAFAQGPRTSGERGKFTHDAVGDPPNPHDSSVEEQSVGGHLRIADRTCSRAFYIQKIIRWVLSSVRVVVSLQMGLRGCIHKII